MKREISILLLILLLACKREEVPVTLMMEFSTVKPTTIEATVCRAHLAGPASLDTTGYVYRWDFESDGIWDTKYSAVPWIRKSFTQAGDRTVKVEAITANGILLTASAQLKVVQGFSAPVPDFTFTPDSGNFRTVFTFNANLTRDAQESTSLLTYSWDFNNDQKFEVVTKGNPVATHSFSTNGVFKVNLLVTDTSKLWARITKEVLVNRLDSLIVPAWKVTPEYPSDLDTLRMDASGSSYTGMPGTSFIYSWKKPRGAWTEPSADPVLTWPRPANGAYLMSLRVYGPDNLYNEKYFEVVVARANKKPTARIDRNIRFGNILSVFQFSAWASSDPENVPSEMQARWDFDGDGAWDTPYSYEKNVQRVYSVPGIYTVKVEIMDEGGLKDVASTTINVSANTNPTSQIEDIRDNQVYGIVQIGKQWWMGENLKWDMRNTSFGNYFPSWCFNDNPAICNVTGRLYYAATVATDYTGEIETRNLCPRGFHIPTMDDWLELFQEVGRETAGTSLAYGGTSDFNILLGGFAAYHHYGEYTEFEPDSLYKVAYFLTAPIVANARVIQYRRNESTVQLRDVTTEGYYSVRCVKDK